MKSVQMEKPETLVLSRWILPVVLMAGLMARLAVATAGHNFDMESWYVVADFTREGGNIYNQTDRYNYGPVWLFILHVLDLLSGHHHDVLRYLIAVFLSLVDAGIFFLLLRQAGRLAASLFFLNPISIIVTGYHCQFDNLAIFLGLWSVGLLGEDFQAPFSRQQLLGLLVLGLSLMTKHLFFAFPLWLVFKQRRAVPIFMVLLVPPACFVLSFIPFLATGWTNVVQNVFCYMPPVKTSLYDFLLQKGGVFYHHRTFLWYGLLIVFGFACRAKSTFKSILIYTGLLVAFAPASSNQYLAIPVALAAVYPNLLFAVYTLIGTVYLCGDESGLRLFKNNHPDLERMALCILAAATMWVVCREWIFRLLKYRSVMAGTAGEGPSGIT